MSKETVKMWSKAWIQHTMDVALQDAYREAGDVMCQIIIKGLTKIFGESVGDDSRSSIGIRQVAYSVVEDRLRNGGYKSGSDIADGMMFVNMETLADSIGLSKDNLDKMADAFWETDGIPDLMAKIKTMTADRIAASTMGVDPALEVEEESVKPLLVAENKAAAGNARAFGLMTEVIAKGTLGILLGDEEFAGIAPVSKENPVASQMASSSALIVGPEDLCIVADLAIDDERNFGFVNAKEAKQIEERNADIIKSQGAAGPQPDGKASKDAGADKNGKAPVIIEQLNAEDEAEFVKKLGELNSQIDELEAKVLVTGDDKALYRTLLAEAQAELQELKDKKVSSKGVLKAADIEVKAASEANTKAASDHLKAEKALKNANDKKNLHCSKISEDYLALLEKKATPDAVEVTKDKKGNDVVAPTPDNTVHKMDDGQEVVDPFPQAKIDDFCPCAKNAKKGSSGKMYKNCCGGKRSDQKVHGPFVDPKTGEPNDRVGYAVRWNEYKKS